MVQEQQESFPDSIAGFRILRRLATGGTSDVLLAESTAPRGAERVVVLKLLLARYKNDPKFERMFAREATAYARLNHPCIVKLYDFFSTDTRHGSELVMVLEFVDGVPLNRLRAWLAGRTEALDDRAAVFLAACVFSALASAHAAPDPDTGETAPVIHRDINPSNVLLPWDGYVKLTDFGIAKVTGVTGDTKVGRIKGTFGYMAPEQVKGETTSTRTDVYAASLMLWELLARRRAIQHQALSELEALRAMAHPSLPSLDVLRPELPAELRALVARGLEPDPARRDLSADEAANVLGSIVSAEEGRAVLAATLNRLRGGRETTDDGLPPSSSYAPATVPEPPLSESDFDTNVALLPHGMSDPAQRPLPRFPTEPDAGEAPPPPRAAPRPPSQAPRPPSQAPRAPSQPPRPVQPPRPPAVAPRPARGVSARTLAFGDKLPMGGAPEAAALPAVPPGRVPELVESRPELPLHVAEATPDTVPLAPPVTLPLPPPVLTPAVPKTAPMEPPIASAPAYTPRPVSPFAATAFATTHPSMQAITAPAAPPPVAPPVQEARAQAPAAAAPADEPGRPLWYVPAPVAPSMPPLEPPLQDKGGRLWAIGAFVLVFVVVLGAGAFFLLRGRSNAGAEPAASASAPVPRVASASARPPLAVPSVLVAPSASAAASPLASVTAPPIASAAPEASAAPSPSAAASAAPPPVAASSGETWGQLHVGSAAAGHRVFLDGHVIGEGPGTYRAKCGSRSLRIGSSGKLHEIDIPCGGTAQAP